MVPALEVIQLTQMKKSVLIAIAMLCMTTVERAGAASSVENNKSGLNLYKQGKLDEAAKLFSEAVKISSANYAAQVNLASVYALWLKAGRKQPVKVFEPKPGTNSYGTYNPEYWDPYEHLLHAYRINPKYVGEKIRTDKAFDGLHAEESFQDLLIATAKFFAEEDAVIRAFLASAKEGKFEKFNEHYDHPLIQKMAPLRAQALRLASETGQISILKAFQKKKWDLGQCGIFSFSNYLNSADKTSSATNPYGVAIELNQIDVFDFLVANKFDTVCFDDDIMEAEKGHQPKADGSLPDGLYPELYPVAIAAGKGYVELLKRLIKIDLKGDVNHRFSYSLKSGHANSEIKDMTLLHIAVQKGQTEVVRYLLANGADPKIVMSHYSESDADEVVRAPFKGTALDWAKHLKKDKIVKLLGSANRNQ